MASIADGKFLSCPICDSGGILNRMIRDNTLEASPRHHDGLLHVTEDVAGLQTVMVNVYFIESALTGEWVLVDAGIPLSAGRIMRAAERRFGSNRPPAAIILTHGHFDHVGSLRDLSETWDVPIYAHHLEMPYLTGQSDYPPPDPSVGGGLMARLSPLYPKHAYNFRPRVRELPDDGSVPGLSGWRWIHTPGHSPGHVSLFRDSDRVLIAGDAFVTQKQESLVAVMTNMQAVHGPPKYFTADWIAAKQSVQKLAKLEPSIAATGHGIPMGGDTLMAQLTALSLHFDELAVPSDGRYVREPAVTDGSGVVRVPPAVPDLAPKIAACAILALGAVAIVAAMNRSSKE